MMNEMLGKTCVSEAGGLARPAFLYARLVAALLFGALMFHAPNAIGAVTRLTSHIGQDCIVAGLDVNSELDIRGVFESTCDFTGGNTDANREIFAVVALSVVTQLTDTTGCTNSNPASDAAGNTIVFESDCDTGSNSDRNIEIYLVDDLGMTQLTDTSFCTSLSPAPSADAGMVAFDSDCDFTGANVDGSVEIFQLTVGAGVTQLTDDSTSSGCASINAVSDASGDAIAFESDCDLIGTNEDQVSEIFQYRAGVGVVQLTASTGEPCINVTPATSEDGMTVAFSSDCDLVGANADNSSEIFVNVRDAGDTQLTSDTGTAECESESPSVSTDGGVERVAFASYCDPMGGNADGSFEIFRTIDGATARLTSGEDCASVTPKVVGDATMFLSNCDHAGNGAHGIDIYMVDMCVCGGPISRGQSTATDALLALQASVGSRQCALCDCDVNDDGRVTATDALVILNNAVGADVTLDCP